MTDLERRVSALRAELVLSRERALAKFESDWGTRDTRKVAEALRQTIPASNGPKEALTQARALIR